jgi:hypothetical protein
MRAFRFGLVMAVVAALVAGCGGAPRTQATRILGGDPGRPYYGKTKTEIIACAGLPASSFKTDSGERLTYHYSGAGPVPGAQGDKEKKKEGGFLGGGKKDKDYKCVATLSFENDRLVGVNHAPKDAVSPYATKKNKETGENEPVPMPEPCSFSLPQCTPGN